MNGDPRRGGASHGHELAPVARQRLLNPGGGRDEDIRLTCFDLLDGADIQVGRFRQIVLCNAAFGPKPPHIRAETNKLPPLPCIHTAHGAVFGGLPKRHNGA